MPESTPQPLPVEKLCRQIDTTRFDFETTADLSSSDGWNAQPRAADAVRLAAQMPHGDFNAFVLGQSGSGRHALVHSILSELAPTKPVPDDWIYVNNFTTPHKPVALSLPAGTANDFRRAMDRLIDDLANEIPALFESEDYQTKRRLMEEQFAERHEALLEEVFATARHRDIAILRTPMGFSFAGKDGEDVISQEQYSQLSAEKRAKIDDGIDLVQEQMTKVLQSVPRRQKELRRNIEVLNQRLARQGVDEALDPLAKAYSGNGPIAKYLEEVRTDLVEHADLFLRHRANKEPGLFPEAVHNHHENEEFQRYRINVMVNQDVALNGAPIIGETLPTMANLTGRVEYASQLGALVTNFSMIKPGALHLANGGYLVLDAQRVLSEPMAWDALKRCLRTQEISIHSPGERMGLVSTTTLNPDPIPLNVRVVLVGERLHYHLLSAVDPDFEDLFKIQADLDDQLPHTSRNEIHYAGLLADLACQEKIRPLDVSAVAALFGESMRFVADNERLTLNTGLLSDLIREAEHYAIDANHAAINASDIAAAIDARDRRADRIRLLGQERMLRGLKLIDTQSAQVGQVNALSVTQISGHAFGQPTRLTARTRPGSGKLIDIERESELGGRLHSKGMLILQGYLAATYATHKPMSLWASLVFEQSYGGVDGDSASAAELMALLSSLADVPVDQSLAVTGSLNQFGQIQPIGGVNEKIEGFFDLCAARGLTGKQGVLIPAQNVINLALRPRVIEAVRANQFRVVPLMHIDDAITCFTGMAAGKRGTNGQFPGNSFNRLVEEKLTAFAEIRRRFGKEHQHED